MIRVRTAALFGLLAAVAAGCSTGKAPHAVSSVGSPATTAAVSSPTTASAAAATTGAATAPGSASAAIDEVTATHRLLDTLSGLQPAYGFTETLNVGTQPIATVTGKGRGPSSEFSITSGGAVIEYIQIPPKSWSRDKAGTWLELDGSAPAQSPLQALLSPSKIALAAQDANGLHFTATYPSAALATGTSGQLDVTMTLAPDGHIDVAYHAPVGGQEVDVATQLHKDGDTTPISAPA